ncbi:MAG: hypothetical protein MZW92_73985 [Comamonadaceae bacterium]|nr:hypothetical protein [Comamonadaceae bacterium]
MQALGAPLPQYAPPVDDPRRRRRRSCPSATARSASCSTDEDGYLPEAVINYLARLGWSHGDDELFTPRAVRRSGSTSTTSRQSPAQFNPAKLAWLNAALHQGRPTTQRLAALVRSSLAARGDRTRRTRAPGARAARCSRTAATPSIELADWAEMLFVPTCTPRDETCSAARHRRGCSPALRALRERLADDRLGQGRRSPRRSRRRWPSTS